MVLNLNLLQILARSIHYIRLIFEPLTLIPQRPCFIATMAALVLPSYRHQPQQRPD